MINTFFRKVYAVYIAPHSDTVDDRRHEVILNTLLVVLLVAASLAFIDSFIGQFLGPYSTSGFLQTTIFWLIIVGMLAASRRGHVQSTALVFVGFLLFSGIDFALFWGFGLPEADLLFALIIVIAGVLFNALQALFMSLLAVVSLSIIACLQLLHLQEPVYTQWRQHAFNISDLIGYSVIFIIIGFVSWLSNKEIDRSLLRARASEAALQKERDSLEIKVAERTHELEDLQLQRLLELQPFAEFGRIGASLVHEIANPLTAANLHLEELSREQSSQVVRQVQSNLHQLERYLLAARKQIKRESPHKAFSVGAEIRQIVNLLRNRARKANVELVIAKVSNIRMYGDVVKFNQLVANLLANAIDASENTADTKARVLLQATKLDDGVLISVADHGAGISPQTMEHLFEPFFSTKKTPRSGLGIGLAMVKQYVDHDFGGSIEVVSSPTTGTVFTVRLKNQARP